MKKRLLHIFQTTRNSKGFSCFFLFIFCLVSATTFGQQKTITGRVASGDTSVAGATVQVRGSKIATQTDAHGNFTINAPANATLVISSIGYANQEVKANNRSNLNVQL